MRILQCLASKEVLVLLIQAPSLEARSRTHTHHIVYMKCTKYNEEKKQGNYSDMNKLLSQTFTEILYSQSNILATRHVTNKPFETSSYIKFSGTFILL